MKFQIAPIVSEDALDYSNKEFWTIENLNADRDLILMHMKRLQKDLNEVDRKIAEREKEEAVAKQEEKKSAA